ncbi:hypothetical protein THRCLA_22258 [Thraustotheca clavata]|uniref:Uncharacterized protein n=1 Tax=Thraustotheca clavata TaxID=74557 RepID=A0A1V9Z834_9STRA|nr:hypothetical protein THRCLA_22258 [Thraustotheca clavata]
MTPRAPFQGGRKQSFLLFILCIGLLLLNDIIELLSWSDNSIPQHLRSESGVTSPDAGLDQATKLRYCVNLLIISPFVIFGLLRFGVWTKSTQLSWKWCFTIAALTPVVFVLVFLAKTPTPSLVFEDDHINLKCDAKAASGKLDAVYTWVNVTDPKWQALSIKHGCPVADYLGGGGDADPFLALKYSMRSVRKNLPFVERIFIVTERDQAPAWVSLGENVHVVFHDEFMPADIVPTFNSNPTEMLLHKMVEKGILDSNCFLYINDDFLINKPLTPSDIIAEDGRLVLNSFIHINLPFDKWMDGPYGLWSIDDSRVAYVVDPHVPYVVHAEMMDMYIAQCGEECDKSLESRCKRNGPLPMSKYQDFLIKHHPEAAIFVPPLWGFFTRLPLGIPGATPTLNSWLLWFLNPKYVYIESHNAVEDYPEWVHFITTYLHSSFPEPGPWEKF